VAERERFEIKRVELLLPFLNVKKPIDGNVPKFLHGSSYSQFLERQAFAGIIPCEGFGACWPPDSHHVTIDVRMNRVSNFRAAFSLFVLSLTGLIVLLREHRPSFLRPDLHSNAYVSTASGVVSVVDLVKNATVARVSVGPDVGELRAHPSEDEIWGVSPGGGSAWVLRAATNQIVARIPLGGAPYTIDFSSDAKLAYTTASSANAVVSIDCASKQIVKRANTGSQPLLARITPDGKSLLVVNHRDGTLGIHDAKTLAQRSTVPVIPNPDDVAVLPDSSVAYVMSRSEKRISVVDLKRGALLANLELAGKPSQMILKPDGGELFVLSPESHGLQAINTWTHEVGDYIVLGSAPTRAALLGDSGTLYISDAAAGTIAPLDIVSRKLSRPVPAGQSPGAMSFDPGEKPRLLLVVSEASGDLSVVRISSDRTTALLTMIPVGDHPREIAVKLF